MLPQLQWAEFNSPWDTTKTRFKPAKVHPLGRTAKDVCVIRILERMQKSAYHYGETAKDLHEQLVNGTFN